MESAVLDAVRKLSTDAQLAAEVVRQAETQLARRREQHAKDVTAAESALRRLNAETTEVAGDTRINPTARLDRLVDLQRQVQDAEHRLNLLEVETRELEAEQIDKAEAASTLAEFQPVWEELTTREQIRLIQMLVAKVGYDGQTGRVTVDFRSAGIKELCEGRNSRS
jgi:site-specific DNA recombinase